MRLITALGVLALAVIGLLVTAMLRPNLVRNTSTHPRTLFLAGGTLAIVIGLFWGVRKLTGHTWAGLAAAAVPVVAVLALVVVPTFRPSVVDEADPIAATPTAGASPGSAPPPISQEVGASEFVGIDHEAQGSAHLIDLGNGELVVRFEDFDVEPGPDYFVHLIDGADQREPGGVVLGALKGTRGNQNYPVPSGVSLGAETTVLIWCRAFAVPVAIATLDT